MATFRLGLLNSNTHDYTPKLFKETEQTYQSANEFVADTCVQNAVCRQSLNMNALCLTDKTTRNAACNQLGYWNHFEMR
jgi:hypothetical protein